MAFTAAFPWFGSEFLPLSFLASSLAFLSVCQLTNHPSSLLSLLIRVIDNVLFQGNPKALEINGKTFTKRFRWDEVASVLFTSTSTLGQF